MGREPRQIVEKCVDWQRKCRSVVLHGWSLNPRYWGLWSFSMDRNCVNNMEIPIWLLLENGDDAMVINPMGRSELNLSDTEGVMCILISFIIRTRVIHASHLSLLPFLLNGVVFTFWTYHQHPHQFHYFKTVWEASHRLIAFTSACGFQTLLYPPLNCQWSYCFVDANDT